MTTYAFTFGAPYDLHDAIVLVEAETAEDAIREFVDQRRRIAEGEPNAEYRWSDVVPYSGSVKALLDLQQYRVVDITTPIHFRDRR